MKDKIDELLARAKRMDANPSADRERFVAKTSFKAGFSEALNTVVATREYDEGKQAGIREVVECIKYFDHSYASNDWSNKQFRISVMHQLKEWEEK